MTEVHPDRTQLMEGAALQAAAAGWWLPRSSWRWGDPRLTALLSACLAPRGLRCRSFFRRILSGILWAAGAVFVMAMLIAIPYGAHHWGRAQPSGSSRCRGQRMRAGLRLQPFLLLSTPPLPAAASLGGMSLPSPWITCT